jgi:hypothetical protein
MRRHQHNIVYATHPRTGYSCPNIFITTQQLTGLLTFVIKSVYAVNTSALVVTTKDEEVLGVFYLIRQQETDRFQRLLSSVNIVAQKQIIGLGRETTVFKQPQ